MTKMVATASFVAEVEGKEINVSANVTRVDDSDELFIRYPHNWVKDESRSAAPEVEQATKAPGETRGNVKKR